MSAITEPRALRPTWTPLAALFSITIIWGGSFVWMKQALDASARALGAQNELAASGLFLALRFGLAALVVLAISPKARGGLDRAAWRGGMWLGALLFAGFVLQMRGLSSVSPAVSAFLTSLYVLFTALLIAGVESRGVRWPLAMGVVLALLGAALVRGRPELEFNTGELLTVACAAVFAVHILATDRITKRVDPMAVTFTSFVSVSLASSLFFVYARLHGGAPDARSVGALLSDPDFLLPLALTTVFATVLALSLMNLFQREIDPVRAAILYALEPIWATFAGLLAGMDHLTPWLWIGGSILLAGNLVAELGGKKRGSSAR